MNEMDNKTIIAALRHCADHGSECFDCPITTDGFCADSCSALYKSAAERLEKMQKRLDALMVQIKLLADMLEAAGVSTEGLCAAADEKLEEKRILQAAIDTYGVEAQCNVCIEEMAELTQVVMKIRRISDDYEETMAARDHLIDEIADVGIMIAQMELMFGAVDVEKMRRKKLLRLKKRLELEGADEK